MFDLDTFYGNLFEICHDYIAKNNLLRVLCFDKCTYTYMSVFCRRFSHDEIQTFSTTAFDQDNIVLHGGRQLSRSLVSLTYSSGYFGG